MADDTSLLRAARSGSAIGVAQLATYALAFFVSVAIAAKFGTSRLTDAYFMAASTSELLAKILLGGALTSVFLPIFIEMLTRGDEGRAWRLFQTLFSLSLLAFVVLGGLLQIVAEPLTKFLAPGFPSDTRALTVLLLRFLLPAYLFSFLADIATVPLHAHRRFGLPAASRFVVPLLTLFAIFALAHRLGVVTLALGTLAGTALHVAILLVALRRSGHRFRPRLEMTNPDVRRVLALAFPFALSILAVHGAGAVYRILVSAEPEGALASLKFGEKIYQMTSVLFLGTVTQIAFPAFAKAAATSPDDLRARFRTAVRIVAFFGIPLTVGIILLREPLVRTLYERGAFSAEATALTAVLVPLFIVGILGNGVSSLLGHIALALQATKLSVAVNVALQAIAASLFVLVTPRLGVKGLALVSGVGPFILTALYLWALRHRVPKLGAALADEVFLRLLAAGMACGVSVTATTTLLRHLPAGFDRDIAMLLSGGIAGASSYLFVAWLLRVPEVHTLRALAASMIAKVRS